LTPTPRTVVFERQAAESAVPTVSIVLPTYNRRCFLNDGLQSISAQTWQNWELIVVDDGGTDDTESLAAALAESSGRQVRYVWQENLGAGAARRRGISLARGELVAFFDSDDHWMPEHLARSVEAFSAVPELDWVFAAAELYDRDTGRILIKNTLQDPQCERFCLKLNTRSKGSLRIIEDDSAKRLTLRNGLLGGLQASVFRRRVFDAITYPSDRIGDDVAFGMRVIAAGFCAGYYNEVHVRRVRHDDHVSNLVITNDFSRSERIHTTYAAAIERLSEIGGLTNAERRALQTHLAEIRFWQLGYSVYLAADRYAEALREFRRGLRHDPWNAKMWKTYVVTQIKRWGAACKQALRKAP